MIYDHENINRYIEEDRFDELINISEQRMHMQLETLLKLVRVKDDLGERSLTDLLMVSGPSSSGKTTMANLLAEFMSEDGYNCTVISLDDYYYDLEISHRLQIEKGIVPEGSTEFDYETIEAIDVEYFRQQMKEYTSGHSIKLPKFDFAQGKRIENARLVESTAKDMIILEGIHAFSPRLTEGLTFDTCIKIYISPLDSYTSEYEGTHYTIEPHQIRFMRRAIRDGVHRGAPLSRTLEMWPVVRRGEKNYMEPLLQYTDVFINSSHEYEIAYLKKRILEMADASSPETRDAFYHVIPKEALLPFMGKDDFDIPEKSLFREFYMI